MRADGRGRLRRHESEPVVVVNKARAAVVRRRRRRLDVGTAGARGFR